MARSVECKQYNKVRRSIEEVNAILVCCLLFGVGVPVHSHPQFSEGFIHVDQKYVYHFTDYIKIDHVHW